MALTDTAIRKIKSTEKSFKITDSSGPNLLLKPNGSKLWYMKYRIDGKEKKLAFGPYPDGYRGGHDAPENPLLTQAACTAYSLKLPIPQQTATPA
ncbi:Arm DNA-binding domain-containing protein [Salmonella enterica]|uniref:Arm DNA-binding domain-containing protein n=1 Tax=Salmonella enterica TaxID=28901 RepID=UPI002FBEFDEC